MNFPLISDKDDICLGSESITNETNNLDKILETPKYDFWRWVILTIYSFLTCLNGMTWVVFYSIIDQASNYYNVSNNQILWFSFQFNIIFIVISFPVIHF